MLLNNAGGGIEATVNKAAPANDATFAFKTGFSARALFGLLDSDNFGLKVSPDISDFYEVITIDRSNGQVELPQPTILSGLAAPPRHHRPARLPSMPARAQVRLGSMSCADRVGISRCNRISG